MVRDFAQINTPKTILYYGGSFNPPHIAHIMMISQLRAYFPKAWIWVAPAFRHAFDKQLMDFDLRMKMLCACFEGIPQVKVSDIERLLCLSDGKSRGYTVDVVRRILGEYPDYQVKIIVGADILESLAQWYQYEELCKIADFLVFPRQGYDNTQALQVPFLPQVSSTEIRSMLQDSDHSPRLKGLLPAVVLEMLENMLQNDPSSLG